MKLPDRPGPPPLGESDLGARHWLPARWSSPSRAIEEEQPAFSMLEVEGNDHASTVPGHVLRCPGLSSAGVEFLGREGLLEAGKTFVRRIPLVEEEVETPLWETSPGGSYPGGRRGELHQRRNPFKEIIEGSHLHPPHFLPQAGAEPTRAIGLGQAIHTEKLPAGKDVLGQADKGLGPHPPAGADDDPPVVHGADLTGALLHTGVPIREQIVIYQVEITLSFQQGFRQGLVPLDRLIPHPPGPHVPGRVVEGRLNHGAPAGQGVSEAGNVSVELPHVIPQRVHGPEMRTQSGHHVVSGGEGIASHYKEIDTPDVLEVDDPLHLLDGQAVPVEGEGLGQDVGSSVLVGNGGRVLNKGVVLAPRTVCPVHLNRMVPSHPRSAAHRQPDI